MAIDMNPAEGRIVLGKARATEFFPWYEKAGVITRIAGKRIYYKDTAGNEKFLHDFNCVVDTPEEEAALLGFTERGRDQVQQLRDSLSLESESIYTQLHVTARRTRKRS